MEEYRRRGIRCMAVGLAEGVGMGACKACSRSGPTHAANVTVLHKYSCLWLQVEEYGRRGIRCMAVGLAEGDGPWRVLGLLTFLDPPRPDTRDTLEKALGYGVDTKMVRPSHV